MNKVSKKQLNKFIKEEALRIISEIEDVSFEQGVKSNAEEEIEKLKDIIDAKQASYGKLAEPTLKRVLSLELQKLREDLKKAEERLDLAKQELEKAKEMDKIEKEAEESAEKEISESIEVVAKTVTETIVDKHAKVAVPVIKRKFPQQREEKTVISQPSQQKIKKKNVIIKFDKNTRNPFFVNFTRRGFLIGDTRLSFETIEKALSKNFTITLKDGFVLDNIKMQKILRYKKIL